MMISCSTNQLVTLKIIVVYKQILMPYTELYQHQLLNIESTKCFICSRKRHTHLPPTGLLLDSVTLEQVEIYRYLGVVVTSRLTWSDHIKQICTKSSKPVGILYRQFYSWADSNTLLLIYCTCIQPHLEYACQLWDTFLNKGIQLLEAVAGKVCLKQWDLDLPICQLVIIALSQQLCTTTHVNSIMVSLYKVIYHTTLITQAHLILDILITRHSFVPFIISSWNNLLTLLNYAFSSSFKRSITLAISATLMSPLSFMT